MRRTKKVYRAQKSATQTRNTQTKTSTTLCKEVGFPVTQYLPRSLKFAFSFHDTQLIATGLSFDYRYTTNGLYDPRYDLGGGQPTFFPSLLDVYSRYHVDKAIIQISWKSTGVDTLISCFPANSFSISTLSTFDEMLEFPNSTFTRLTDSGNPASLTNTVIPSELDAMPSATTQYLDYSGDRNSNPLQTSIWHVMARSVNGVDTLNCRLVVRITYYTTLFGLRAMATG